MSFYYSFANYLIHIQYHFLKESIFDFPIFLSKLSFPWVNLQETKVRFSTFSTNSLLSFSKFFITLLHMSSLVLRSSFSLYLIFKSFSRTLIFFLRFKFFKPNFYILQVMIQRHYIIHYKSKNHLPPIFLLHFRSPNLWDKNG